MTDTAPLDLESTKAADRDRVKQLLSDKHWRLNNLYWIKDKDGVEIPFKMNAAQKLLSVSMHTRDIILKARQLGFSTFILILILDDALFKSNTNAGIIDVTLDDAKAKLEKIQYAYAKLPASLRARIIDVVNNTEEMKFSNGSTISVGTSYRGGTLQNLLVSELGKISAKKPDVAKEIKKGTIQAVPKNGKIWVESTAEGRAGEFFDMDTEARKNQAAGKELSSLEFKAHFFAWWMEPGYRLPSNLAVITPELDQYFTELRVKHGIPLDAFQRAWYAVQLKALGPDDIKSEYPSTPEEAFFASNEGAYFRREMTLMRQQRRIGVVPFDPSRPVNTSWDIGTHDNDAIWFHQTDGMWNRLIDYYETSDGGLIHCINILREKMAARGFRYGKHFGPHDIAHREWSAPGLKTRAQIAAENGIVFTVVPQVSVKQDSIENFRQFLSSVYIDEEHCQRGIDCLDNYSKTWNDKLGVFENNPAKNGYQHGADSGQQLSMGLAPDDMERRKARRKSAPKGVSQWGR